MKSHLSDYDKKTRQAALTASVMSSFITPFMGSAINVGLPSIGRDFGMNAVMLGWVTTSYILSCSVFLVPLGRLADLYGRKKIFFWGISLFTFVTLFIGLIPPSTPLLLTLRFIQGIGSAMIFGTGMTILISVYSPHERGKVLGLNVASVYLGSSLGPFLGGILTEHFSWRSLFLVLVPPGLFLIYFIKSRLHGEWAEARGEPFDLTGSLLYGFSLFGLMYGFSYLPQTHAFVLVGLGILLLGLFGYYESKIAFPIIHLDLFRNKIFALSALAALINYCATFGVGFVLSLYLQYVRGLDAFQTGIILLTQPVLQTLFSPVAGKMADHRPAQSIASLGMAVTALGLFMLIGISEDTSFIFITLSLAVLGFGFAFFSSPNTTAAMNAAEKKHYGVASSIIGTMRLLGQMFSMGISIIILSLFMKDAPVSPQTLPVFLHCSRLILTFFALLCTAGIFLKTFKKSRAKRLQHFFFSTLKKKKKLADHSSSGSFR